MRFAVAAVIALVAVAPPAHAHGDNWRTTTATKWTCISHYESAHRWHLQGYHSGGLQFSDPTWDAYTGPKAPNEAWQASKRFQIRVAKRVAWRGYRGTPPQGMDAWSAWRVCR